MWRSAGAGWRRERLRPCPPDRFRTWRGSWWSGAASAAWRPPRGWPSWATRSPCSRRRPGSVARSASSSGTGSAGTPGPTHMLLPAVVRDLFRKSGRPLEKELDLVPVEPMRQHRFEDGTRLDLPSGSRSVQIAAIDAALGDGLGRAWAAYTAEFPDAWEALRKDWLERPWSAEHASKRSRDLLGSRLTLAKMTGKLLKDDRLRQVATLPAVLEGHDPRNVPAWTGLVSYVEQNFGCWTVPGGMGAARHGAGRAARDPAGGRAHRRRGTRPRAGVGPRLGRAHRRRGAPGRRGRGGRRPAPAAGPGPPRAAHDAGDPAGRRPPRDHRRGARPAPRGGAARRPAAGAAHQRHGAGRRARLDPARTRAGSPRTS